MTSRLCLSSWSIQYATMTIWPALKTEISWISWGSFTKLWTLLVGDVYCSLFIYKFLAMLTAWLYGWRCLSVGQSTDIWTVEWIYIQFGALLRGAQRMNPFMTDGDCLFMAAPWGWHRPSGLTHEFVHFGDPSIHPSPWPSPFNCFSVLVF